MKTYTKGAKLRAKKAGADFGFALDPVKSSKPKARGRKRQEQIEASRQAETLAKRAHLAGLDDNEKGRDVAKSTWFECQAGIALWLAPGETEKLWQVVKDWRKHEARFLGLVLSRRMYPGRDSVPHLPDKMETRDDFDYDLRGEDERVQGAKDAWRVFCEQTKILNEQEARICFRGVWDREPNFVVYREPDFKPKLTYEGAVFASAIAKVHKAIAG